MAFGGIFGGNKSSSDSTASSASTDTTTPSTVFDAPPSSVTSPSGSSTLHQIQTSITEHANVLNAQTLMSKINELCFANCVVAPGSSLSIKEQSCLTSCMEKYLEAHNVTHTTYIRRLQRESKAGGALGSGKELF